MISPLNFPVDKAIYWKHEVSVTYGKFRTIVQRYKLAVLIALLRKNGEN